MTTHCRAEGAAAWGLEDPGGWPNSTLHHLSRLHHHPSLDSDRLLRAVTTTLPLLAVTCLSQNSVCTRATTYPYPTCKHLLPARLPPPTYPPIYHLRLPLPINPPHSNTTSAASTMPPTPVTLQARPRIAHHSDAASGSLNDLGVRRFITVAPRAPPMPEPKPLPPPPTANQRRKARPAALIPTSELLSSKMVPQNVTIVTRCLVANVDPPSPTTSHSNKKRTSHQHTPTASPTPHQLHIANPYSRLHDLANTRSTIPSPQELARAERAEEEKARQKKENAAAARAAAALARRRKALRSGRGSRTPSASVAPASMIPPIQRAMAKERARSAESAVAQAHSADAAAAAAQITITTAEPEDGSGQPPLASRGLKRTRSSGLSNVTGAAGTPGAVSINSPLRTVTNGDDAGVGSVAMEKQGSSDAPARKRSRLAELPPRVSTRRASTVSPTGSTTSLPAETTPMKTTRSANPSLSPTEPTSSAMRRVVSATEGRRAGSSALRTSSVGPDSTRERSRRDVQPPARMRDYT